VLIFGVRPGVPQDGRRAGAADHGHLDPGLLAGLPRGVAAGRISRSFLVCSGKVETPNGCYLKRFANRAWRIGVPAA
jgi:hypothetical protein